MYGCSVNFHLCSFMFVGERYFNPLVKQAANNNNTSSPNKMLMNMFSEKKCTSGKHRLRLASI